MYADKTLEILGEYYTKNNIGLLMGISFEKFVEITVHSKWSKIK